MVSREHDAGMGSVAQEESVVLSLRRRRGLVGGRSDCAPAQ
jgi:hypothetical protein